MMKLKKPSWLLYSLIGVCVAFLPLSKLQSQTPTPGGVTNPAYTWAAWLTPDSYNAGTWTNLIPGGIGDFAQQGSTNAVAPPITSSEGFNFNPVVVFSKSSNNSSPNRLLSQLPINLTPSENITMFFVIQRKSTDAYDYLISFSSATTYNNLDWNTSTATSFNNGYYYYDNLYYYWSANRFGTTSSGVPFRNGILAIDNSNVNDPSGGSGLQVNRNGLKTSYRAYQNGTGNVGTGCVALGSYTNANVNLNSVGYGYEGNIQEVILLKKTGNGNIADIDMQKILSYLSVKYGIPLNNTQNYLGSDGTVVWSRPANIGYSNSIFGLARDDNSRLYVKQSAASDPNPAINSISSAFIAYIGDELKTLNSENTGTFNEDKTYILFGSNGQSGITNYPVLANTSFANGVEITEKIEYRSKTTYKTQLTGLTEAVVNIKRTNADPYTSNTDVLFVSSDKNFDPSVTDAYLLDNNGIATNVKMKNGYYLMFAKRTILQITPPVYTERIWLKAGDLASLNNGDPITTWNNYATSSWGNFAQTTTAQQPLMNKSVDLMNFHPSVNFTGNRNMYIGSLGTPLEANKSYYVFYVSQLDGASATNQYVLFAMNGNAGNFNGWYQKNPSFTSNSTAVGGQQQFIQSGTIKNFGITGIMRPNTGGMMQSIYLNGDWQVKPAATVNLGASTAVTRHIIGGSSVAGTPANAFTGKLQELIVFESDANAQGPMDPVEVEKINSYLAFKYGLTLDIGDYIDKNGDVFWSRAKAVDGYGTKYENTIFGLGRNDAMGVYQKQARAYNKPNNAPFAVYMGPLTGLNQDNNTVLEDDNSFLMFSADQAIRSFRSLNSNIPETVVYRNGLSFPMEMNYTSAIFQVQAKNWPAETKVNFRNMTASPLCYLLVSRDPMFEAANTDIYPFNITTEIVENIAINDGDYVCMLTEGDPAPGGVFEDLRMWMNPTENSVTLTGGGNVSQWRDFSSNGNVYGQTAAGQQPPYSVDDPRMNYHPSVVFNDKDPGGTMVFTSPTGIMNAASPDNYIFFTVLNNDFQYNGTDRSSYPMGFGGTTININTRHPAFGTTGNADGTGKGRIYETPGPGELLGIAPLFKPNSTIIMSHAIKKNTKVRFEFNAQGEDVASTTIGNGSQMAKVGSSGVGSTLGGASLSSRYLHGPLSEIFAYERELDQTEKDAIYSYLGLKYGITIDPDVNDDEVNFDYFLSDNTVVWPGTSSGIHNRYHHNVAALVRDDNQWLNNTRSHSTGDESIVFMGIGTNDNWTGFENDKQAIVWGHDSAPIVGAGSEIEFGDDVVCGDVDSRLRRIWLVDNSTWKLSNPSDPTSERIPSSQKVVIRLDDVNFPYPADMQYQIFMLVADSEDDLYGGTAPSYDDAVHNWKEARPSTIVDGEFQFEYTFTNKYTYFTFGIKELGGGCVGCAFGGSKRLDFLTSRNSPFYWPNGSRNQTYSLGDDFSANIALTATGGADFYSSTYPRAYTNKSLRVWRRGNSAGVVTTTIKPISSTSPTTIVPATASFEIYRIGNATTRRADVVEVVGKCNGMNVYPKLSYMAPEKNSTYRISRNIATGQTRTNPGYTNNNGRMFVEFKFPVEEITINYKLVGTASTSATGDIGIGPVTFACPPVMPPVNEAGLSFIKEAPTTVNLCSNVEYIFRIYNSNCSPKDVNFRDTLPEGMVWQKLQLGGEEDEYQVNDYNGQRELTIDDLPIPPGDVLTFKAIAAFDNTAVAGDYENQAVIEYSYIVEDVETPDILYSADRYRGVGEKTVTTAYGDVSNKIPAIKTNLTCKPNSYSLNSTLTYTLTIENQADIDLEDVGLSIETPDGFLFDGDITGDLTLGTPDPENGNGWYYYSGMTLAANTTYTLTFKVKSPASTSDLPIVYDEETGDPLLVDGKEVIADAVIDFALQTDGDYDDCILSAFDDANGSLSTPYKTARSAVISNKNVTSKINR